MMEDGTGADCAPREILCCVCGALTPANPAHMCVACLRSQVDVTEGIPKEIAISWCKGCGRYLHNNSWVTAPPESRELLSMLVRKVRGLSKVKLVDASFVWTEPHSKRLKLKLTVQKEVFGTGARVSAPSDASGSSSGGGGAGSGTGAILQQSFIVEYVLENLYCPDCHKAQSPHTWVAQVQLRQRGVGHKRTLYYVEQLILKRGAHANVVSLKEVSDGLDFFFVNQSHAKRFTEFVTSVAPARVSHSKKLISHDDKSNIFGYKYSWLVEIAPICRDDLVLLPRGGKFGQGGVFLCTKVTSGLQFLDPLTLRRVDVSGVTYWSNPFRSICSAPRLQSYDVIDSEQLETVTDGYGRTTPTGGVRRGPEQQRRESRYCLADATIVRSEDLGKDENTLIVRTHLGYLLKAGDLAYGYDLKNATFDLEDDPAAAKVSKRALDDLPDVLLVKKTFRRSRRRRRQRIWTLQRLEREQNDGQVNEAEQRKEEEDMEALMRELEENPDLRANVPLVRVPNADAILAARKAKKLDDGCSTGTSASAAPVEGDEDDYDDDGDDDELPDVDISELIEPLQNLSLASRRDQLVAQADDGEDGSDPVAPEHPGDDGDDDDDADASDMGSTKRVRRQ